MMIIAKKIAWLIVCPQFCKVERIPEAAPRCSGGHEFITDAMLGDIKIPLPMPKTRSIIAKGKYSKFEGNKVKIRNAIPVITMPVVASTLAPCLSDNHPLKGPVSAMPIDIGSIKMPAQKGVES
jgi:hypothetical protein